MKEFLRNVKYTVFIIALMFIAGIVFWFGVGLVERLIGLEATGVILAVVLIFQIYGWVKSARKQINDKEE